MKRCTATALALAIALAAVLAGCTQANTSTSQTSARPSTAIHIDYANAQATVDAAVPFDASLRPAQSFYAGHGATHPAFYTAFDQLVGWSESAGVNITASYDTTYGFLLAGIAHVPRSSSDAYWSLSVNDKKSDVGMDAVTLHAGDRVSWTLTSTSAPSSSSSSPASTPPSGPAAVAVSASGLTIYQETALVNGTAPPSTVLTYKADADAGAGSFQRRSDGTWTLTLKVSPGRTNVTVTDDDGTHAVSARLVVTRLVQGTVQVDFRGAPGHANHNDRVWIDVDAHASNGYYKGQPVPHPAYANVHDLLVTWTNATGVAVVYKPDSNFGQQLMQIDGVGDPTLNTSSFWCYNVNGSSAPLGITAMEFKPGDVVSWNLGGVGAAC